MKISVTFKHRYKDDLEADALTTGRCSPHIRWQSCGTLSQVMSWMQLMASRRGYSPWERVLLGDMKQTSDNKVRKFPELKTAGAWEVIGGINTHLSSPQTLRSAVGSTSHSKKDI